MSLEISLVFVHAGHTELVLKIITERERERMGQSSWSKVLRENASKKGASDRRMISNKLVNRLKSFNQTCKEHHSRRQYSFDRLASDLNESTSSHIQHIEIELDGESAEKMIEFVDHILPSIRSYIMKE